MANVLKATSLKKRGFSRCQISQLCHMRGSPFYQITEGGSWWVVEEKLEAYLDKLAKEKEIIF